MPLPPGTARFLALRSRKPTRVSLACPCSIMLLIAPILALVKMTGDVLAGFTPRVKGAHCLQHPP